MGMNNVTLVGRLTKDPDLRYTANGKAVANFTLAINRSFNNPQGERDADFINCVAWDKPAENLANFMRKGSRVGVVGRIQTRNYENDQGQRVFVTEVVAENIQFLESKNNGQPNQNNTQNNNYQKQGNRNNNYKGQQGQNQNQNQQFGQNQGGYQGNQGNHQNYQGQPQNRGGQQPFDINNGDLPF